MDTRFELSKVQGRPRWWVCTDLKTNVRVYFEHGKFNETQEFVWTEALINNYDKMKLARAARDFADFLGQYHYDIAMNILKK
jgi:hypothetical protein